MSLQGVILKYFCFSSGNILAPITIKRQIINLNFKKMERSVKSKMAKRDLEELIGKLTENEILNPDAMRCVRGGDGDGGGDTIMIPPKEG